MKWPIGLTDEFHGFIKLRKRSILVIYFHLNDSASTAVKMVAKFETRYVKGVLFLITRYLFREKWYIKG